MEIRPNTQKNFVIARVAVNKGNLIGKKVFFHDNAEIVIPLGYSLYYTHDSALVLLGTGEDQAIKSAQFVTKIKDTGVTTLYWLRNTAENDYEITVPWGIVFLPKRTGYNGQIKLKFNIKKDFKFISQCMCACETEMKDGLNYEYLSEYYIDEKNEQKGMAVAIRELLVPYLANCKDAREIETEIKDLAEILFKPLGLILDETLIVVKKFVHSEKGSE